MSKTKGYFGIGVENISKVHNVGALMRTAHAFEASFVFTVGANYAHSKGNQTDTSKSGRNVPLFEFDSAKDFMLPRECSLVGIELVEEAIELPSFHHPKQAAYILGPERGSLSPEILACCDHVVKIPTKFCVNVGLAGALVMYDRTLQLGKFAPRAPKPGGPVETMPISKFGDPVLRRKKKA